MWNWSHYVAFFICKKTVIYSRQDMEVAALPRPSICLFVWLCDFVESETDAFDFTQSLNNVSAYRYFFFPPYREKTVSQVTWVATKEKEKKGVRYVHSILLLWDFSEHCTEAIMSVSFRPPDSFIILSQQDMGVAALPRPRSVSSCDGMTLIK